MSYRGRLTAEAQRQLLNSPDHSGHGLTDEQISALRVDDVDVSPTTPDTFLAVDCSLPMMVEPFTPSEPMWKVRVILDQRTALRILFGGLLDETNVLRTPRRTPHEIANEINQRVYEQLRRSADDQR